MKKYFSILTLSFFSCLAFAQAQNLTNSSSVLKNLETPDSVTSAKSIVVNHIPIDLVGDKNTVDGF